MDEEKLTTKQRLFVEAYLANPNATEAARIAGYKGNDKTLSVVGAENLAKPSISRLLEKKVEAFGVNAELVITGVRDIALDTSERTADRLKAYELLGKHLEIWTDRQKLDGTLKVEIEYV